MKFTACILAVLTLVGCVSLSGTSLADLTKEPPVLQITPEATYEKYVQCIKYATATTHNRKIDNVPNGIRIMNFWNPKRSENVRYIVEIINIKPKATIKYWSAVGSFAMGDIESAIKNCANE